MFYFLFYSMASPTRLRPSTDGIPVPVVHDMTPHLSDIQVFDERGLIFPPELRLPEIPSERIEVGSSYLRPGTQRKGDMIVFSTYGIPGSDLREADRTRHLGVCVGVDGGRPNTVQVLSTHVRRHKSKVFAKTGSPALVEADADLTRLASIKGMGGVAELFDLDHIHESPESYFAPPGMYLWDPWFFPHDGEVHAFFLQLPRTRSFIPAERDFHGVEIGHAVSADLRKWAYDSGGVKPGAPGQWDDASIWDGNVISDDGVFHMLYTGVRSHDLSQRIGHATSKDLIHWRKDPENPVLTPDGGVMALREGRNVLGQPPCFRDPFLFKDEAGNHHLLLSEKVDPLGVYDGYIGHYTSTDLKRWKKLDPLIPPGRYDVLEEPQMVSHAGRNYLFFSTNANSYSPGWRRQLGAAYTGMHCYVGDELEGTYRPVNGNGLVLSLRKLFYGGKVISQEDGRLTGMGWLAWDDRNTPIGRMSPPFAMKIYGDNVWCEPMKG
ncbi:MAG: hypothetical protein GF416_06720 [Candidatus Altiarchaeales archaeon]|nr:hypothetical protein [Candidatus Altiarchaeales archaeon]MBD3416806.1 hypothetical protein [Candidatus Altiarchaeales archaeon]